MRDRLDFASLYITTHGKKYPVMVALEFLCNLPPSKSSNPSAIITEYFSPLCCNTFRLFVAFLNPIRKGHLETPTISQCPYKIFRENILDMHKIYIFRMLEFSGF